MNAQAQSSRQPQSNRQQQSRQYVTFRVGPLFLGIEAVQVREILLEQEMTAIPLAPDAVEGLINLRGRIVIAIDMRRGLGLPRLEEESLRPNLVIRSGGASGDTAVSLLVDRIGDVVDVPLDACSAVPVHMPSEQQEWMECVCDLKEGLLLVLDTDRLLQRVCEIPPEINH